MDAISPKAPTLTLTRPDSSSVLEQQDSIVEGIAEDPSRRRPHVPPHVHEQAYITGRSNTSECKDAASFEGKRFLAYGSGSAVIVYTADLSRHVQTFSWEHCGEQAVTAIACSNTDGKIAVAYGRHLAVFSPSFVEPADPARAPNFSWSLSGEPREHSSTIKSLSWSCEGALLAGGMSLWLWDFSVAVAPQVTWSIELSGPIERVAFSPDGTLFYSYGPFDRLVKIWFKRPGAATRTQYDFVYIQHPRSVLYCEWRKSVKRLRLVEENVLLTMARDSVGRLWTEQIVDGAAPSFYLACTFDHTLRGSLGLSAGSEGPQPAGNGHSPGLEMPALHWMDQQEVFSAVDVKADREGTRGREARTFGGNAVSAPTAPDPPSSPPSPGGGADARSPTRTHGGFVEGKKVKRLKEALREHPDMLLQAYPDGTVVVWGVQHLTSHPRRMPKVNLVMKIARGLDPSDFEFFEDTPLVFHNEASVRGSAVYFPSELVFIAQNSKGILRSYLMNLEEFFAVDREASHVRLTRTMAGHASGTKTLEKHPVLDLTASVGNDGGVIVWRTGPPLIGSRSTQGLDYVGDVYGLNGAARSVAWLPHGPFLAVECSFGVRVFVVSEENPHIAQSSHLEGYDGCEPLAMLWGFPDANKPSVVEGSTRQTYAPGTTENGMADLASEADKERTCWIVGVATSGITWAWRVEATGSAILDCAQPVRSQFAKLNGRTVTHAFPTNTFSALFAPFAGCGSHLFGAYLTDGTSGVLRFWDTAGHSFTTAARAETMFVEVSDSDLGGLDPADLKILKANAIGKVAVVRRMDGAEVIQIWEYETTGWKLELEDTIHQRHEDRIVDIDWYLTGDAQSLLAVGAGQTLSIYCASRKGDLTLDLNKRPEPWRLLNEIWTHSSGCGQSVAWLFDGSIALATGHEIVVHNKWLADTSFVESMRPQEQPLTIFDLATRTHGCLPDHHPMLLVQYLVWGKYALTEYSLGLVSRYVRLMLEAGKSVDHVPTPLWKIFAEVAEDSEKDVKKDQYEQLFEEINPDNARAEDMNADESQQLIELLTRVQLPYVTAVQQTVLVSVIGTLVQVEAQKRTLDENGVRYVLFLRLFQYMAKALPPQFRPTALESRDVAWAFFSESQDVLIESCTSSFSGKILWQHAKPLGMGFWIRNIDALKRFAETLGRNAYMGNGDERDPVACALWYAALGKKKVLLGLWRTVASHPEQPSMLKFLSNDFAEDRWQKAAAKNAFVLMSKQRFEYAVAFFLLGNRLKDAVSVCLSKLEDPQLAFFLARVYEGDDGPILKSLIHETILPRALQDQDHWTVSMILSHLKLRELALKSLLVPAEDVLVGIVPVQGASKDKRDYLDPSLLVLYEHLKKSYASLRFYPKDISPVAEREFVFKAAVAYERMGLPALALKVLRHFLGGLQEPLDFTQSAGSLTGRGDTVDWSKPIGGWRRMSFQAVSSGLLHEDDAAQIPQPATVVDWSEPISSTLKADSKPTAIDWSEPVSSQKASEFDWSEPATSQKASAPDGSQQASAFDWSEPVGKQNASCDWSEPVNTQESTFDWSEPVSAQTRVGESRTDLTNGRKGLSSHTAPTAQERAATRHFQLYEWVLGMRVLQAACRSTAAVFDSYSVIEKDDVFKAYYARMRDGFFQLCGAIDMPLPVLERILNARCKEIDSPSAFIELLPVTGDLSRYSEELRRFVVAECNNAAHLTFELCGGQIPKSYAPFLNTFSRRLLGSLSRWNTKLVSQEEVAVTGSIPQTACTAFVTQALSSCTLRNWQGIQILVATSFRFFDSLKRKSMTDLYKEIDMLLEDQEVHVDVGEDYDEDELDMKTGEVIQRITDSGTASFTEDLITYLAVYHVAGHVQDFMRVLEESGADELFSFVRDGLLRSLSSFLDDAQKRLASRGTWTETALGSLEAFRKSLRAPEHRRTLALLKAAGSSDPQIPFEKLRARALEPTQVSTSSLHQLRKARDLDILFKETELIGSFAINHADDSLLAIVTGKHVYEIDVEQASASAEFTGHSRTPSFDEPDLHRVLVKTRSQVDVQLSPARGQSSGGHFSAETSSVESADSNAAAGPGRRLRTASSDSVPKLLTRSNSFRRGKPSFHDGLLLTRDLPAVAYLEPHPSLSFYLAAVSESTQHYILLFQFGQQPSLQRFVLAGANRITRLRFDPLGHVFGATDIKGDLFLFKFETSAASVAPYMVLSCHSGGVHDFTFLGNSSLIATAGLSAGNTNVSIWDTMLPEAKRRVKAFSVNDSGAYSLAFSNRHQLLMSGGKKGDISAFDVRKRALVSTFQAHQLLVKSLCVDEDNDILVSGSTDGDVKLWDLREFRQVDEWKNVHAKHHVLRKPGDGRGSPIGTYGVTDMAIIGGVLYTCGADGTVQRGPIRPPVENGSR